MMRGALIGLGASTVQYTVVGPFVMVEMAQTILSDPLPFTIFANGACRAINRVALQRADVATDAEIEAVETFYRTRYSPLAETLAEQLDGSEWFASYFGEYDRWRAALRKRVRPRAPLLLSPPK